MDELQNLGLAKTAISDQASSSIHSCFSLVLPKMEVSMPKLFLSTVCCALLFSHAAFSQGLEVRRFNSSEWTKGRFSELITVNGPGKTIYLAGIGAEDETSPAGASAAIRHIGDPYLQCKYAYDKIKRLLSSNGGSLANIVKQVVYVTDIRYQAPVGKCRQEEYGSGPIPANTFLVINGLAIQGMLLEIDVTAVVP